MVNSISKARSWRNRACTNGRRRSYQPAQKCPKDRKGRALSFEDVKHYQRILKILSETDRIMQTITMDLGGAEG